MSMHRRLNSLLAVLIFLLAPQAQAGVFDPQTFTLDNGMQVVVVSNHRAPIVSHMVWYKVGSADEPEGKSGLAHFFEHLMFKGTKAHPDGVFSKIVARNGGQENAFTSYDFTAYYQNVAKDRLPLVMKLEADRMRNLTLTKEVIEPERLVILEERRSRVGNNPGALLGEQVNASFFVNHPYRNPIIGWAHEVEALSLKDLTDFYDRWYAPNNAILVVAGDITAKELKPLAEKYYGTIPANPDLNGRVRAQEPPHYAGRRIEMSDPRVRQVSFYRSYLAPSFIQAKAKGETERVHALEVLAEIIGSGPTSRLSKALVFEGRLAVSAGASYAPDRRGPAKFTVWGSPLRGVSVDDMEKALFAEIDKLLKGGVAEQEVAEAQKRLIAEAVFARDGFSTGAQVLGAALAIGKSIEDVESWPDQIAKVTVEQVNAAAKAVFNQKNSVTAVLLPEEPEKEAAR